MQHDLWEELDSTLRILTSKQLVLAWSLELCDELEVLTSILRLLANTYRVLANNTLLVDVLTGILWRT